MLSDRDILFAKLWKNYHVGEKPVILRMPDERAAARLEELMDSTADGCELPLKLQFDVDRESVSVILDGEEYAAKVKHAPSLAEVYTSTDRKTMSKLATITKIIDCTRATETSTAEALTNPVRVIVQERKNALPPDDFTEEDFVEVRKLVLDDFIANEVSCEVLEGKEATLAYEKYKKQNSNALAYARKRMRDEDEDHDEEPKKKKSNRPFECEEI